MKYFQMGIAFLLLSMTLPAQSGKYISVQDNKHLSCKVYIDYRVIEYAGTGFTTSWSGSSKMGYAEGEGQLAIDSKAGSKVFHISYNGNLIKGKKEGKGILLIYSSCEIDICPPYFKYTGDFKNDEFSGFGEFTANWGGSGAQLEVTKYSLWRKGYFFHKYKGYFKNGDIADSDDGEGTTYLLYAVADETKYSGGIKNGVPDGSGKAESTNSIHPVGHSNGFYEGGFSKGKLQGQGKLSSGTEIYEGNFSNNQLNGKGKITNTNPSKIGPVVLGCFIKIIEGDFTNGKANGVTVMYLQNCAALKFEGFTTNGIPNGTAKIDYLNGDILRGNFQDGKMEGKGVINFSDGTKFDGEYINGEPVRGIITYKDGFWYEGEVRSIKSSKNGYEVNTLVRHGHGTFHESNGQAYDVNCVDDNCTRTN